MFKSVIGLLYGATLALFVQSDPENSFEPYNESVKTGVKPIAFVPIVGGKLDLGEELEPAIIDDFWMATLEISWDQYDAFVYETEFSTGISKNKLMKLGIDGISGATSPYTDMSFGMGRGDHPATNMTQYAALMFCKWLSAKTGNFYRLPTEAEWVYACKNGSIQLNTETLLRTQLSPNRYSKAGSFQSDNNGVFDMLGNVSEWTMDEFSSHPEKSWSGGTNPWTAPKELYPRTLRGGSWRDDISECTCDRRLASRASWKKIDPQIPKSNWWHTNAPFIGFRVVRPKEALSPNEIKKFWLNPIEDFN